MMEDRYKNMDKVFRDRLGDYHQQPPEEIWDGIKAGLGNKSRRKILIPLWQAAAGAALLITTGSLFYFLNRPGQDRVAEQLLLMPSNIQAPDQSQISASAGIQAAKTPGINSFEEKSSTKAILNDDRNKGLLETAIKSEKIIIADNTVQEISGDKNTETELTAGFSAARMPESYLPMIQRDQITAKKKTYIASWEMLEATDVLMAETSKSKDRLLLTAQVSPTYSYRDIGNIGANESSQYNQNESGRISYSGGLQFGYKTTKRLSIHAGLMYAQLAYNINQVGSYNTNAIATGNDVFQAPDKGNSVYAVRNSIGTISANSDKDFIIESNATPNNDKGLTDAVTNVIPPIFNTVGKIEQYFQYLEVPFLLRYRIIDRKLGVSLVSGVSTNILVGNHASLTIDNKTNDVGTSQNVKNFNYMGNLGLGFDYILRKNLLFTVEPQFKYFLNSINQSSLVNRPYMLGMFTGVRFMW